MKIESIKKYLRPHTIMERKSTLSNAFASALAPHDMYSRDAVAAAVRDLGQDPDDDLRCVYCGKEAATWDHVFGRVVKGEYSGHGHRIRNLVPCCRTCNERKGQKAWMDWLTLLAPEDLEEKILRLGRFLSGGVSGSQNAEEMRRRAEPELTRFLEIRSAVFALLQEADTLAAAIRQKAAAAADSQVVGE